MPSLDELRAELPDLEELRRRAQQMFAHTPSFEQTDFRVISSGHVYEEEFEVVIRNHKDTDVTVQVIEPLPGDWRMLSNTHDFEKVDAFTVRFPVPVEAGGETTLRYRIQIRF